MTRKYPDYWFHKISRWFWVPMGDECREVPLWEPCPDWAIPFATPWLERFGRYWVSTVDEKFQRGWPLRCWKFTDARAIAKDLLEEQGGTVEIADVKTGKYAITDLPNLHLVTKERLEDIENV